MNYTTKSKDEILDKILFRRKNSTPNVFIIGGGKSYSRYISSPDILKDQNVICTNNAYKLYPDALCTHFSDECWYHWHLKAKHNIHENFKGPISTTGTNPNRWRGNPLVYCFQKIESVGIAEDKNIIAGNNAGHQAINLAVHLEFKNIILVGFDMCSEEKEIHWHNDHERQTNTKLYDTRMLPAMEKIVPFQEKLGFKIWNLNKESCLRYFDFCELKDFI